VLLPGKVVIRCNENIKTSFGSGEKIPILLAREPGFSRGYDPKLG